MQRLPSLIERIAALIGIPSISSVNPDFDHGNRAVIDLLAGWLDEMGFAVEVMPVNGDGSKANLVATLGTGPGGLILAGHTDTVPFDDRRWSADPFTLSERNQRLYGLGTCDMKSFFAMALEAARPFVGQPLREPLYIIATADEESSMDGARLLQERGEPKAAHAVVGEPTSLKPVIAHKGIMMECIRLTGRSGHSSDPRLGNSALEGMHQVMGELLTWRGELQARYRNPLFAVEVPTLNLGHIHGGDNPNRICGECELHIDLRPLPGMGLDDLREEMRARLAPLATMLGLGLSVEPLFTGAEAMETPASAAIVQAAEKLTGISAGSVAYGTEGPFFTAMGAQTLILGPGSIDQAHQPDEFIALDQLNPTVELLRGLIARFCL